MKPPTAPKKCPGTPHRTPTSFCEENKNTTKSLKNLSGPQPVPPKVPKTPLIGKNINVQAACAGRISKTLPDKPLAQRGE
jgi:hypothetical protein